LKSVNGTNPNFKIHLVLLPVVFFICLPALFIKQNIQDIHRLDIEVVAILVLITLAAELILLSTNAIFREKQLKSLFGGGAEFLLFFIVSSGFVFPAAISTGMVSAAEATINLPNLAISFVMAGALSLLTKAGYRQLIHTGLILFISLNTALSCWAIFSKFYGLEEQQIRYKNQILYEISAAKNIFVLSLDGISGTAAKEVMAASPELVSKFDGFTLFSRVAASSPATSASLASSLYGNQNFKILYQTEQEVWDSAPDTLLTNYLQTNGLRVSAFGPYNKNFYVNEQRFSPFVLFGISFSELVNFTIARSFTPIYVLPESWLESMETNFRNALGRGICTEINLTCDISLSQAPDWKKRAVDVKDLVSYVNGLRTGADTPTAQFLHFTFTHFPVEFDRDCNYRGNNADWYYSSQNWFGVKEETYCALSMYIEFISKLKTLNVFQQSMIVLKSDHGKPVSYSSGNDIESAKINGHPIFGYGRYAPFLAIKAFGETDFNLIENPAPVLLDDLAKTVCTAALGEFDCAIYPGFDILDENLNIPDSATATLFIVKSGQSNFSYDTHKAIEVRRNPGILQNLRKALSPESH